MHAKLKNETNISPHEAVYFVNKDPSKQDYKEVKMPGFDGTGPFGDGRPGKGRGNCRKSQRSTNAIRETNEISNSGYANSGIKLLADTFRNLITNKNTNKRR